MMDRAPLSVELLGAMTCEDTAITRSRLVALDIPFREVDVDADPAGEARIRALNGGRRVTPTVVLGDDRLVVAEPTVERLDELLAEAGHVVRPPAVTEYHGELTRRAIPLRDVPSADRGTFSLASLRGRRQVALFLAHDPGCLVCFGYAKQLARRREALDDADALALAVVSGPADQVRGWRHEVGPELALLADEDGSWKRAIANRVSAPADGAILLALDRFLAPRVGSFGADAGGLIDPSAVVDWLRFLVLECPECAGEIAWADG